MNNRYRIAFCFVAALSLFSFAMSQTQDEKEQLMNQAQQGIMQKLSPEQLQAKLKELGITEEQARQMAKERGVKLEDFILGGKSGQTKIRVGQQGAPSVEVSVPKAAEELGPPPEAVNVYRDASAAPRGPAGLEYFGYGIFKQVPAAFEPSAVGPVDPGYLLGAGDVLRLTVWGQAEFQYELEVDREGRVFIPNVGQVFALGTPLNQLQQKFKLVLSKYYSGLATSPQRTFMDVTITKLRPLRVFVMGEVKQPGGYTISSYATVFNALYAVGGPLVRGSLRDVRVIRDNQVVANVDLYDYLLRGDKTSDVRLQNNDIIFIPTRGRTVSIRGEIRRPGIYELKGKEDLRSLIDFSGGLLTAAYLDNAQIDRIKPFDQRKKETDDKIVVDFNLGEAMKSGGVATALYDADELEILSVLNEKKNYVRIEGSVWRPGRFELGEIKTVRKLVKAAEGVLPKTFLERAHLIRFNDDRITTRIIPFDLGQVLSDPAKDMNLAPQDMLVVFGQEVTEIIDKSIEIFGQVKKPGKFALRDNMTLTDLIVEAGGFTEDADLLQAEVSRIPPGGLRGDSLALILHLPLSNNFAFGPTSSKATETQLKDRLSADNLKLQHRDQVLIRPNPDYKLQKNLTIAGDFTYPGVYAIKERGEKISEILGRAGGPTKTTYMGGAEYVRDGKRVAIDIEKAYLKKDKDNDIVVFEGDRIVFPEKPRTVVVVGEVNRPGLLSFLDGDDVGNYIDRAGGLTDSASYAILVEPTGESRRVNFGWFSADPTVPDGSNITVLRKAPEPPEEKKVDWGATIKDSFALAASAATIIYLISQVKK